MILKSLGARRYQRLPRTLYRMAQSSGFHQGVLLFVILVPGGFIALFKTLDIDEVSDLIDNSMSSVENNRS